MYILKVHHDNQCWGYTVKKWHQLALRDQFTISLPCKGHSNIPVEDEKKCPDRRENGQTRKLRQRKLWSTVIALCLSLANQCWASVHVPYRLRLVGFIVIYLNSTTVYSRMSKKLSVRAVIWICLRQWETNCWGHVPVATMDTNPKHAGFLQVGMAREGGSVISIWMVQLIWNFAYR